ncbi:MAG: hypothetical protein QMC16_04175 [Flavobacteriales bacterium]
MSSNTVSATLNLLISIESNHIDNQSPNHLFSSSILLFFGDSKPIVH